MADRETPAKRIVGIRWLVDKTFHKNLNELLATPGVTAVGVAKELSKVMGETVHDSGIRHLRSPEAIGTGSVLAGPLCKLYKWPVPPLADAEREGEWVIDASAMYELQNDPAGLAEIRLAIRRRVQSNRELRKLRGDSDT